MGTKNFHSRSKIWIEDNDGNVVFGLGRFRILSRIREKGSIQAAAKELKMGYKAIWSRIKASEERLGENLLVKTVGGKKGGGSQLTPLAEELVEEFGRSLSSVEKEVDSQLKKALEKHITINPEDDPKNE